MNDPRLDFEKLRYIAIRDKLIATEAEIDEQTLADTTEGLTDLHELLAAAVRGAIEDEMMATLIDLRIEEMKDRRDRFNLRAARRRETVRDAMQDCDIKQLKQPEFTASLRDVPQKVVVIEEKLIPPEYFEMRPHLKKRELGEALKRGAQIEGAMLSNSGKSLFVTTR